MTGGVTQETGHTAPARSSGAAGCDPPGSDAARLETVEIKLAHLERAVQELSDVIYRQQKELDRAREMNRQLSLQLDEFASRANESAVHEIPPHY